MHALETPKVPYFSTLLSACCTRTEQTTETTKTYHLTLPGISHKVCLIKTSEEVNDTYTWKPDTPAVLDRLLQLNIRVVHLSHILQWSPESISAEVLAVGEVGPVISVTINSIDRELIYSLREGIVRCSGDGTKHEPIQHPKGYSYFHEVFNNATHIQCFMNRPDRSLNTEDALSIYKLLSDTDKSIINSNWRFKNMGPIASGEHLNTSTSNFKQGANSFSAEQIIGFALYLGVGDDRYRPCAMLSAIQVYKEDKDLFRSCIGFGTCTYEAIGYPELQSKIIIDENIFLQIVRENPTCKTVVNLLFCLSLKVEGHGLYFDADDYLNTL